MNHQQPSFILEPSIHTGELFQLATPEKDFSQHVPYVFGKAALELLNVDEPAQVQRRTLSDLKSARQPEERDDAYRDLGGNIAEEEDDHSVFEQIAAGHEPWMVDISLAIDDYTLHELTPARIHQMTKQDKRTLTLHTVELMRRIHTAKSLIPHVNVSVHPFLEGRYDKRPTPSQMLAYLPLLEQLEQAIIDRGVIPILQKTNPDLEKLSYPNHTQRWKKDLEKGPIHIVYAEHDKPKVERKTN